MAPNFQPFLGGSDFCVLSLAQEMRHMKFLLGSQNWVWVGGQKVYVENVYVFFSAPYCRRRQNYICQRIGGGVNFQIEKHILLLTFP